ncbi:MAG: DUF58 domain-containing protein [Lachnospiraceae bacterium]|nr:DUF58 domain-containing protein [Lachnospiraceae bacterium]
MAIFIIPLLMILLFTVYNSLYKKNWTNELKVQLEFLQDHTNEGEECELTEVLTNKKIMPLLFLQLKFCVDRKMVPVDYPNASISDQTYVSDVFTLRSYERLRRVMRFKADKRGYYTIEKAELIGTNLFTGKKNYFDDPQQTYIYVYPRLLPVDVMSLPFERLMGLEQKRSFIYEDPFTFRGVRDYRSTDSLRNINWKLTAKTGDLMVNLRDSTVSSRIAILLNLDDPQGIFDMEVLEDGIRMTLTMADGISKSGISAAVKTNAVDFITHAPVSVDTVESGEYLKVIARALARIDLDQAREPFSDLVKEETKNSRLTDMTYCVISSSVRADVTEAVSQLAADCGRVLWLCPTKKTVHFPAQAKGIDFYPINLT